MKTAHRYFWGWLSILLLPLACTAAEPLYIFGLPHTPIGGARMDTTYGYLQVSAPLSEDLDADPVEYGVSVETGEAPSGVWGELSTGSSFQVAGSYLLGKVYGKVNGVPGLQICSVRAETINPWSSYLVSADFNSLGSATMNYEVLNVDKVAGRVEGVTNGIVVWTSSENAPKIFPFWNFADGTGGAIIQFSCQVTILLPNSDEMITGTRIVIRPDTVAGTVDFVSRVEVLAGGGESQIYLSQERLGIFGRTHQVLGDAKLRAAGGQLTVAHLTENVNEEIGASVKLDAVRQFALSVQPLELATNGAAVIASAVGNTYSQSGEFLGFVGVQNQVGALSTFANFGSFADALQINVLRGGLLVGSIPCVSRSALVGVQGQVRVAGFSAAANKGAVGAGFGIRFVAPATFSLPNQSSLVGDELRFVAVNAPSILNLAAFSLTCSNIASVTIVDETGPQLLNMVDYFPEATAAGMGKEFLSDNAARPVRLARTLSQTNLEGHAAAILTDRWDGTNLLSETFSMQEDGLYFHGLASSDGTLFNGPGVRLLPEQISVSQIYASIGSFQWTDQKMGVSGGMQVDSRTTVAALEELILTCGTFWALRLETISTCTGLTVADAPGTWISTNWLVPGVGVVKFARTEVSQGGASRSSSGELVDYVIFNQPRQDYTANVGANIAIPAWISTPVSHGLQWMNDGYPVATIEDTRLPLSNVQLTDTGVYAVQTTVGELRTEIACEVGDLQVIPFYDAPSWATSIGGGWSVAARAVTTDGAGNVYLAGTFYSTLYSPRTTNVSRGSDDVFIMKVLPSGEMAWLKTAGSPYSDNVSSLVSDSAGNIYMAGTFAGTAIFGTNQLSAPAQIDPVFITKIDPNGNFLWAVMNGGSCNAYCAGMGRDGAGNLYVLGEFSGGTAVFGGTSLTNVSNSYWNYDLFLTKLNTQGQFVWAKQVADETASSSVSGNTIEVDSAGNCYLGGTFGEQATFGAITLQGSPPRYQNDGFLAKADANGNFLWAKAIGGAVDSVSLGASGDVFITGSFYDMLKLDGTLLSALGGGNSYLVRLGPDGAMRWGQVPQQYPSIYWCPMLAEIANNLYVTSLFYTEANYGGTIFQQPGSSGVLSKLDPAGHTLWHKQITGAGENYPRAMARDGAGNVYLAGEFRSSVLFGTTVLSSTNYANVFLTKIPEAISPVITRQPVSQTVSPGGTVSFAVSASGSSPLQFQWRKNGQNIPGAIDSIYTIPNAAWSDAGIYSVVVKCSGGLVVSSDARLQVVVPDGGTVALAQNSYSVAEADGAVAVTVVRSGNTSGSASVDVVTSDGTAVAGEDYWATAVSLVFAPGETSKTVSVHIMDDMVWEPTENFFVQLTRPGPGTVLGETCAAMVTITDDDRLGAPDIRRQPISQTVLAGNPATLSVLADGAPPLTYQWHKDGTDLPGATDYFLTFASAQLADAGSYSVTVRNELGEVTSGGATLRVNPVPDIHFVMFGLTNRPIGGAQIATNNGILEVTPRVACSDSDPPPFGVSVTLGEADSGVLGYLATASSFQNYGNYTEGYVYGQLNGVPNQLICSLKATTVYTYGAYSVEADFSPLSPVSVTYQIYKQGQLVASAGAGPVTIWDYNEYSPMANPFWRLPDGTIAAVVQLSAVRALTFGPEYDSGFIYGDQIVIRAEKAAGVVDFASRVDVLAGGGEDLITITQERLGVFRHSHLALGGALLNAQGGMLTIASQDQSLPPSEIGTAIGFEGTHQARVELQTQNLTDGSSLMASAVVSGSDNCGEFLGAMTLKNAGGTLQLNGSLPISSQQMQIMVYRGGSPVGSVLVPSEAVAVQLSGNPGVMSFEAAADNGLTPPWLGLQLDQPTTFVLPGAISFQGDQIRFRAASHSSKTYLMSFSLTSSNLPEFTIKSENSRETISLATYVPEFLSPNFIKKFSGTQDGAPLEFFRTSVKTNLAGNATMALLDQAGATNVSSEYFTVKEDGFRWHGVARPGLNLVSSQGLFQLPDEITFGATYQSQGTFQWRDETSGEQAILQAISASTVQAESLNVAGTVYSGLRVETMLSFSGSDPAHAPVQMWVTNWLGAGLGLVKFSGLTMDHSGQTSWRQGELTDCAILKTAPQTCQANIGAQVALKVEITTVGAGAMTGWRKNGQAIPETGGSLRLDLAGIQNSSAGIYSVVLGIWGDGIPAFTTLCDVFTLVVTPFSDTPPYWVNQLGASSGLDIVATAADASGNVFAAGNFQGNMAYGTNLGTYGNNDVYLAKLNSSGQIQWVKTGGGYHSDSVQGLGVDAAGNAYMAGTFYGTANFGSLQVVSSVPTDPVFITKVDPNGNFVWALGSSGTCSANCNGMAADASGNVYLLGSYYNGTLTLGSMSLTNYSWTNRMFVAKLNTSGQCLWLREGLCYASPSTAALGPGGAFYVAGSFGGSFQMDGVTLMTPPNEWDAFLLKLDANGNAMWGKNLGSAIDVLAVDGAGNLCVGGEFCGSMSVGEIKLTSRLGGNDTYIAKFGPDGTLLWFKPSPVPFNCYQHGMTVDSANNLYVAGEFGEEATFEGITYFQHDDSATMLCKMDPAGRILSYKHMPSDNWPRAMGSDGAGNVYLAGAFYRQMTFGESNLVASAQPHPDQYLVENGYLVKITGATGPTITQQPASADVTIGQLMALTVSATGSQPMSYQWRKNDREIPGANDASYVLAAAGIDDAGSYSVLVKNAGGSVASSYATVRVTGNPAGTVALEASEYVVVESNTLVMVAVLRAGNIDTEATVELQTAEDTATAGLDFVQTDAVLRFAPGETRKQVGIPILDDNEWEVTETFSVRLRNPGAGVTLGEPSMAVVRILDNDLLGAPIIQAQPCDRSILEGHLTMFYVTVSSPTPLNYQWLKDGVPMVGATNRFLTFDSVKTIDAGIYSVAVWNVMGAVTSTQANLTVIPAPMIVREPNSETVPRGEAAAFYLFAQSQLQAAKFASAAAVPDPGLLYQWLKDGVAISGATGPAYRIEKVNFTDAGTYSVQVTDPNGLVSTASSTLTVGSPLLRIYPASDGQVQFRWNAAEYRLQATDDPVHGAWVDVPNGNFGITLPASETQRFYRLNGGN